MGLPGPPRGPRPAPNEAQRAGPAIRWATSPDPQSPRPAVPPGVSDGRVGSIPRPPLPSSCPVPPDTQFGPDFRNCRLSWLCLSDGSRFTKSQYKITTLQRTQNGHLTFRVNFSPILCVVSYKYKPLRDSTPLSSPLSVWTLLCCSQNAWRPLLNSDTARGRRPEFLPRPEAPPREEMCPSKYL